MAAMGVPPPPLPEREDTKRVERIQELVVQEINTVLRKHLPVVVPTERLIKPNRLLALFTVMLI